MSKLITHGNTGHIVWSKAVRLGIKRKKLGDILKVKAWLKENKLSGGAFHSINAEKELNEMINGLDIRSVEVTSKELKKILWK